MPAEHFEIGSDYWSAGISPKRSLGQNFLTDKATAILESEFGRGKGVIELGPGMGMLTEELCKTAKSVLAVEKDTRLYNYLKARLSSSNLILENKDFFGIGKEVAGKYEILISNVPYNLSSKVLSWVIENRMEAVLCLQKEFVDHMLAKPGSSKYTNLSVFCSLFLSIEKIAKVPPSYFKPAPKVESEIIHIRPKACNAGKEALRIAAYIMEHKKKRLKNAIMDSRKYLGMDRDALALIIGKLPNAESRPFKLRPEELLESAEYIDRRINSMDRKTRAPDQKGE